MCGTARFEPNRLQEREASREAHVRIRVFATTSASSSSRFDDHVMPPPEPYSNVFVVGVSTAVRIGTENTACGWRPSGASTADRSAVHARGSASVSSMIAIAAIFGAPVTEPQGNSAPKTSSSPVDGGTCACTVDVSCQTVSYRSRLNSSGTETEPVVAIRPRSLRSRSTIMQIGPVFGGLDQLLPGSLIDVWSGMPSGCAFHGSTRHGVRVGVAKKKRRVRVTLTQRPDHPCRRMRRTSTTARRSTLRTWPVACRCTRPRTCR